MTDSEKNLIEAGWAALVERLGLADATRFVMLLDRRTGGATQHIQRIWLEGRMTNDRYCTRSKQQVRDSIRDSA
ncbi:MAG: hypothetical protein HC876_11910 [Chloroflexaceae bacterium]|nr:hypothetical protein [Chloroflexaceae bacterium]NJO06156.1 hypothetical protein [Chloroflexaceae bacterium]